MHAAYLHGAMEWVFFVKVFSSVWRSLIPTGPLAGGLWTPSSWHFPHVQTENFFLPVQVSLSDFSLICALQFWPNFFSRSHSLDSLSCFTSLHPPVPLQWRCEQEVGQRRQPTPVFVSTFLCYVFLSAWSQSILGDANDWRLPESFFLSTLTPRLFHWLILFYRLIHPSDTPSGTHRSCQPATTKYLW